MNPAFLDEMSWEMAEVYGAITDQILVNLARHFPYYQYVDDIPSSAFTYQAAMLAQMGQVSAETVQIIRNSLQDADLALQGVLEQAIIDAVKTSEPELLEAVKKGVFTPSTLPAVVAPEQMRAFQLYYQQAADKLNLVNTVMLESTRSAYQQTVSDVVSLVQTAERINATQTALDVATGEVVTGVSSWNTAIRHATDRMKANGITGFIDHAGHQWGAEGYVAMDIRTTVFNTGRAAVWEMNQDFGNDLYLVSYHNGARPLCYDWQNKVISSTDNARTVYDLDGNEIHVYRQSDTSYGQAAGLFGINCKHYPSPFIPGVSTIKGQPQDKEANDKTYAESQQQRSLERKIREEKRDLQMMKAQGASAEEIAAQREKIKQTSSDIDTFCNETGRHRHRDREAVYTKREFPDADRYDVSKFESDQKKLITDYYKSGGEQQGYTFGEMTTNEPIVPATTVPVASQNVASQATTQQYTSDMFKNVKGMKADAQTAMANKLLSSGNDDAIKLYGKYKDDIAITNNRVRTRAYFSPGSGGIAVNVKNAIAGSDYEEPFQVLFHEFGHNVDWLAGGKNRRVYLSNTPINGVRLQDVIRSDYQAFMQKMGATTNSELITMLKNEGMDKKTCGNISDILEYCTHKSYPLGIGHGASYHFDIGATEKEFFAEVLDSSVCNSLSYEQMKRLFPNAVDMVWQMIKGVI